MASSRDKSERPETCQRPVIPGRTSNLRAMARVVERYLVCYLRTGTNETHVSPKTFQSWGSSSRENLRSQRPGGSDPRIILDLDEDALTLPRCAWMSAS